MACGFSHYYPSGVVWQLLGGGAHPSPIAGNGWTPLLAASLGGHSEIVGRLLGAGARHSDATSKGWNSLHMASQSGHTGEKDNESFHTIHDTRSKG